MKYIKLLFLILVFSFATGIAEELKTVHYSDGPCLNSGKMNSEDILSPTNLQFEIIGDSMRVYGVIEANCCGSHLLSYEMKNDSLFLYRQDTGVLCDCFCSFSIDAKIGKCTSNEYTVCLATYSMQEKWEIISKVAKSKVIEDNIPQANVYPNPFSQSTRIEFSNPNNAILRFELYNQLGELVKIESKISTNFYILQGGKLSPGIYYYRIIGDDNSAIYNGSIISN